MIYQEEVCGYVILFITFFFTFFSYDYKLYILMRCIYVFVQALSPCIFQVCKIKQMYFAVSYLTIQDIAVLQYFSCEFDTFLSNCL